MRGLVLLWSWVRLTCTILYHKLYIVIAGRWINGHLPADQHLTWGRMLLHDLSKFHPAEFFAYANHFNGPSSSGSCRTADPDFDEAWKHHYTNNDHHPEYCAPLADGSLRRMPDGALVEMVADLFAAGQAYEGSWPRPGEWVWLQRNYDKIKRKLHPTDMVTFWIILCLLGYAKDMSPYEWSQVDEIVEAENEVKLGELKRIYLDRHDSKKVK